MNKILSWAGFKFGGSTICYAFMHAAGLVGDHLTTSLWHAEVNGQNIG